MTYVVIEQTDDYIVCHGSCLSWAEAHLIILHRMYEDVETVESGKLQEISLYSLEANDPGLGVSYEVNGKKVTYYILDDPGCET